MRIYDPDLDRRAASGQQCGAMRTVEEIRAEYPLHWHIWHGELEQLQEAIDQVRVAVGWGGVWPCGKVLIELARVAEHGSSDNTAETF